MRTETNQQHHDHSNGRREMTKILNYIKSLFKKRTGYYVKIENSGASTAMNMIDYFMSPEGREELKKTKEFYEKYKGVPLND